MNNAKQITQEGHKLEPLSNSGEKEIIRLLRKSVHEMRKLNANMERQVGAADKNVAVLRRTSNILLEIKRSNDVIRRQSSAEVLTDVRNFSKASQLSFEETLTRIADEELSFSRFGDGEFRLMTHLESNLGFQPNSRGLMRALSETLAQSNPMDKKLLIGFPHVFRNTFGSAIWSDVWDDVKSLINSGQVFGNSHVTRPVFFTFMGREGVELWRRVWAGLNVRVITGNGSRFEAIPDLFDSAKSISFQYVRPENSFEDRAEIVEIIKAKNDFDLNLIALGPFGTILSSDLANLGIRAIDVGHINGSYENVNLGAPKPEFTPRVRS